MTPIRRPLLAAFLFLTTVNPARAGNFLTADQIRTLIAGNTVHATHLIKGFAFAVYFDADGKTAIRKQDGVETTTTYGFQGDMHCIHWQGKDRCANIRDKGDGSFARVNGAGKEIIGWDRIVAGKNL